MTDNEPKNQIPSIDQMLQMLSQNHPRIPTFHEAVTESGLAGNDIFDQYALESYEKNAGEILHKMIGRDAIETKINFESEEISSENYEGIIPFLIEGKYIRILSLHLPFYIYLELTEKGYEKRKEYIEKLVTHEHENLINEARDLHARMVNLIGSSAIIEEKIPEDTRNDTEGDSEGENDTFLADGLNFRVSETEIEITESESVIFASEIESTAEDISKEALSGDEMLIEAAPLEETLSEEVLSEEVLSGETPTEIEAADQVEIEAELEEDDDEVNKDDGIEVIMPAEYEDIHSSESDESEEYRPVILNENDEIIELTPADMVDDRNAEETATEEAESLEDLESEKVSYEKFEEHEHHHQEVVTSSSDDHTLEAFGLDSLKRDEELLHEASLMPRIKPPGDYYLKPIPNVRGNVPLNPDHIKDESDDGESEDMDPEKVRERIIQNIKEQELLDAKEGNLPDKKDDKSFDWPDSQ